MPPNLPPGRGDERRLTQVLLNLVGNAIKFTDQGEVAIKAVGQQRLVHGRGARHRTGHRRRRIRTRFSRNSSRPTIRITRKKGGTGLGLSIAKRIIEMHGGRFGSNSELGPGLDLLLHGSGHGRTTGGAVMSKRILVVEDQEDNRQILRDLLGNAGYEMIEAEDGEEALPRPTEQRPDLILMDIQLPVMDGYEATRRIKADPELKAIPIIAVTSYALERRRGQGAAAGCDAYVTKPYSPRQLLAKMREYLA